MLAAAMIKILFVATLLFITVPPSDAGKRWRVAASYPGTYEKKDPLHSVPDDGQSKMQKHMARMRDVFDFRKGQSDNPAVVKVKAKSKVLQSQHERKKEKVIPKRKVPFVKQRRNNCPPGEKEGTAYNAGSHSRDF
ncbi:hypothetical protein IV203_019835 [Nitzschia inconspicua]|uniref:Uncharacterized protein n=1 Tax=Nitzschia inconspicua TaxID=303405 RepID=A0A9K3M0L8_9STRA|nr:hypothetical protein IV203_020401 [Nitzschia inconspicua]KAG7371265.1 hypothetical protein IV203_019835 [Nitzschia inconspicua]